MAAISGETIRSNLTRKTTRGGTWQSPLRLQRGSIALLVLAAVALTGNLRGAVSGAAETPVATIESSAKATPGGAPGTKPPANSPGVHYDGGQLRINVLDTSLADVLAQVAKLTGAKIDVPPAAGSEKMPVVELGPGPARQVLTALLSDSGFDYFIQGSDTDPQKLQSIVLMTRDKKDGKSSDTQVASVANHGPYARAAAQAAAAEEPPPVEVPAPAQPDTAAADTGAPNPPPAAAPPGEPTMQSPRVQPEQPGALRPGALTPPATLNQQSINQQLQQMYQQRAQLNQQMNQANAAGSNINPGSR